MDLGLNGKSAILSAASQGLGKACAQSLAAAGVNLTLNARTQAKLEATAEEIRTEYSHKYAVDEFCAMAGCAGFTLSKYWTDPARRFAVLYFINLA